MSDDPTTNSELTVRSGENNLGISGDAQDALELAGRGIALVGTLLNVIEEEKATVERLQALIPHRVQLSRRKGWRMPPNTVSIARPHRWGNIFRVGSTGWIPVDSTGVWSKEPHAPLTREQAVQCFQFSAEFQLRADPHYFDDLRGRNVACFCRLDQACHGDVILELANRKEQP